MNNSDGLFLLFWIAFMFGYMEMLYYKWEGDKDGR